MSHHYTTELSEGKYTVITWPNSMEFLRYGEAWPAADDLRHVGVVRAMAERIEELEMTIRDVVDGERDGDNGARKMNGLAHCSGNPVLRWLTTLRNVLDQK